MRPIYRRIIIFILMPIAGYLLYSLAKDAYTIYTLRTNIATQEQLKATLEEERIKIEKEINNLSDPEYVIRYAQGNYLFTQDGETVIVLPEQ